MRPLIEYQDISNLKEIQVWKFGGASLATTERAQNVYAILKDHFDAKGVLVASAKGKTTNALEQIVNAYTANNQEKAFELLAEIRDEHIQYAAQLMPDYEPVLSEINDLFVEIEWVIEEELVDTYDFVYDQIVSIGELASTKILYHYLQSQGMNVHWWDIRDGIITDNTYREAKVNWDLTLDRIQRKLKPLVEQYDLVITQGFIGSSTENFTTTLGREGSDYTAAILSYGLDAASMHIWKDVPGILTGDPTLFKEVMKIDRISYKEAVEMTYYGAKVIHEKTIKPLQNKKIPLYVRPFLSPEKEGTLISDKEPMAYPPVTVVNKNQSLLHISTKDFSFVGEHHLSHIFKLFAEHRIKVNMMRNTAISFTVCTNDDTARIASFAKALGEDYDLAIDNGLELVTIRHYTAEVLDAMTKGKLVMFQERLSHTVHVVMKELVQIERLDQ